MNEVIFLTPDLSTELPLMYADGGVRAGFPSPAQDYVGGTLDLNKELVEHPAASFDLLLVDRSLEPFDGCIAICCIDNEFTVKRVDI